MRQRVQVDRTLVPIVQQFLGVRRLWRVARHQNTAHFGVLLVLLQIRFGRRPNVHAVHVMH